MHEITRYVEEFVERDMPGSGRFLWHDCYRYFGRPSAGDNDRAINELHSLLVSWGMYRGNSFLAKKDKWGHQEIVKIVRDPEFVKLREDCAKIGTAKSDAKTIEKTLLLYKKVEDAYRKIKCTAAETKAGLSKVTVSSGLVSKVMLGTVGCLPAFDDYAQKALGGIKELRGWPSNLTDESKRKDRMERLWVFYRNNEAHFIKAVEKFDLTERHCAYPPMKMMDMYLWGKGQFLLKQEMDRAIKG